MLGQSHIDYYLGKDMILSPKDEKELESILFRLCNFEPIQYVPVSYTHLDVYKRQA